VWWKIAIPVLTVIVLIATAFHPHNFTAGGGFMPFGLKGVFTAVAAGGVIFAYLGFEQAIQLGGESKNPGRNIPLAVVGSMILGVVLYILLQVAFLGALEPSSLSKGWDNVAFGGKGALFGPFAGLATPSASAGWRRCCTSTRSSRRAAPACSTSAPARASPSRSGATATSRGRSRPSAAAACRCWPSRSRSCSA